MEGHTGRAGEHLETAEQNRSLEAMELLKAELLPRPPLPPPGVKTLLGPAITGPP